ncbi:hypothetical protein E2C01_053185 [Portunus trituberculatus]|uniref:Uncharacterized protein n=1 Tax=Portunus trituberculatus TaxID=210409 RepID=A0A5B7GFR2_PORTR|nr:hypothetical protein [Portunus trituberculatus]
MRQPFFVIRLWCSLEVMRHSTTPQADTTKRGKNFHFSFLAGRKFCVDSWRCQAATSVGASIAWSASLLAFHAQFDAHNHSGSVISLPPVIPSVSFEMQACHSCPISVTRLPFILRNA